MRRCVVAAVVAILGALAGGAVPAATAGAPPGAEGCPMFPADSFWHADVRSLPVHARSEAWLAAMGGPTRRLHPDFGDSGGAQPYGIPYAVVDGTHPRVAVDFEYADESDPGPYPFGPDIPVEGGSDRHALMVDRDRCELAELYAADWNGGAPTAGSGAVFDLRSNALRPSGWTSADAAGLPILPGLLRRDEVLAGVVDHPIRMTAPRTDRSYVWPARHQAGAARDPNLPPMGAWFRLRADYPTAGLHPNTRVILEAFKTHGLLLADNGSSWYFTGAADRGWESEVLDELKAVPAGAFDAIDASSLMVDADTGQVRGAPAAQPSPTAPPTPGTPPSLPPTPGTPPSPAPTTTAPPRPPATTVPTTSTAAPPETSAPTTTVPLLPTTEPVPDEVVVDRPEVAAPAVAPPASDSRAVLVAAVAVLVTAAAAALVIVLLRRRNAPPAP